MVIEAICPFCKKTIRFDDRLKPICSECGQPLVMSDLRSKGFIVDHKSEATEIAIAKDYFKNTEFLTAMLHFEKVLTYNANSYIAKYFMQLCDIYLNEETPGYDVIEHTVQAISTSLLLMSRSTSTIGDKFNFIYAMLTETKIIICNKLKSHSDLYAEDISKFRTTIIFELKALEPLFKIDGELMMTYTREVSGVLMEICDIAILLCHQAVQSTIVGDMLLAPTDFEYKTLATFNNSFSYFANMLDADYDIKKYTPDFSQNNLLNDKVMNALIKFDANNKSRSKRFIISEPEQYNEIIDECKLALNLTYDNCFKSLCDPSYVKRIVLLKDGLQLLFRLLKPRVIVSDKKRVSITIGKFVEIADLFGMLDEFVRALSEYDNTVNDLLHDFYQELCDIFDDYFDSEYDKFTKFVNKLKDLRDENYEYYKNFLFDSVCSLAVSLNKFVKSAPTKDRCRQKLVKLCKRACEEFLLLCDYKIDEIDQSNFYRPLLNIYNAVLVESDG